MAKRAETFEEFRARVVSVALDEAKTHGCCDTVTEILRDKLGLGDVMPPVYVVQERGKGERTWRDYDEFDDVEDALHDAKEIVMVRVDGEGVRDSVSYVLRPGTNVDTLAADLRDRVARLNIRRREAREYPKWRVIARRDGDTVLYDDDTLLSLARS